MISYADALGLISTKVRSHDRKTESVLLDDALGRTCGADLKSSEDFPARPTSAMDGFAVRASVTEQASTNHPIFLRLLGEIAAGDEPTLRTLTDGCWEIMTGAALPDDCDACVRLEDASLEADGRVRIAQAVIAHHNIRRPGEDFRRGDVILKAGQVVRSEDILCLATLGIQTVTVYRKPRIAIIATGKELSLNAQTLDHSAQIRNSTTPFLLAALRERGAEPTFLGMVTDEAQAFFKLFEHADAGDFDLILTTGALSVGRHDFIAAALTERRTEIFFQKVAIRPGKPLLFGQTPKKTFIIGLPGNPVATLIGLRFFVESFLQAWFDQRPPTALQLLLKDHVLLKPPGVTSFFRASLNHETGTVRTHAQQKASLLSPLLQTDVWIQLPETTTRAVHNDRVSVWPYFSTLNRR